MDWLELWKKWKSGLMGLGRPEAPNMGDYMTTGPDYMSTRPADMPPMLSYTPRMMEGKPQWAEGGQVAYQTADTDYDEAMAAMRQDAVEHVQDWSTDYPGDPGDVGQYVKAPSLLSPIASESRKPPVAEMALYGQPPEWPSIASIVNLKRKERRA